MSWFSGISDLTAGGWLIELLYLFVSVSCWRTARKSTLPLKSASHEHRVWQIIAALFLILCIGKQFGLETKLTEVGRSLAFSEGWYGQRYSVQLTSMAITIIVFAVVAIILISWARNAPLSTFVAIIGATFTVAYLTIRAISYHPLDQLIGKGILGIRWNWILQISGVGLVLMASEWRKIQKA